jgi:hypothetical protein
MCTLFILKYHLNLLAGLHPFLGTYAIPHFDNLLWFGQTTGTIEACQDVV